MSGTHPQVQRSSFRDVDDIPDDEAAMRLNADLEAMQAEFLKAGSQPAATAIRTNKPKGKVSFAQGTKPPSDEEVPKASNLSATSVISDIVERENPTVPPGTQVATQETGFPSSFRLHPQDHVTHQVASSGSRTKAKGKSLFALSRMKARGEDIRTKSGNIPDVPDISTIRMNGVDDEMHRGNLARINEMSKDEIESAQAEILSRFDQDSLNALLSSSTNASKSESSVSAPARTITTGKVNPPQVANSRARTNSNNNPEKASARPYAINSCNKSNVLNLGWIQKEEDLWKAARGLPRDEKRKLQWMHPEIFDDVDHEANTDEEPSHSLSTPKSLPRFDLNGKYLPPGTVGDSILYHHGDNPEDAGYNIHELGRLMRSSVSGQRILAMRSLHGVLQERSFSLWSTSSKAHPQHSLPSDLALTIRCAIDDSVPAVLVPALLCLERFMVPALHECERDVIAKSLLGTLSWAPLALAQGSLDHFGRAVDMSNFPAKKGGNLHKQDDGDDDKEDDADVLSETPVYGLIHSGTLQRFSYLLGCEPKAPPSAVPKAGYVPVLRTLVHIARHSNDAVASILQHQNLLPGIVEKFIDIPLEDWENFVMDGDLYLLDSIGQALKLVTVMVQCQRHVAIRMLEQGVLGSCKRFLGFIVSQSETSQASALPLQSLSPEVLNRIECIVGNVLQLWRCCLCYGMDGEDMLTFLPTLSALSNKLPNVANSIHHVLGTYMRYCLDELRVIEFNDDSENSVGGVSKPSAQSRQNKSTTEVGERVKFLVDELLMEGNNVVEPSTNDSCASGAAVLDVVEAYGRLLMGPQPLHLLSIEQDLCNEVRCSPSNSNQAPEVLKCLGDGAEIQVRAIGQLRESIASTISLVCNYIVSKCGWKGVEAVTRQWMSKTMDVSELISRVDWIFGLVRALCMCLDASKHYSIGVTITAQPNMSPLPLFEAMQHSRLFKHSLPQLLDQLLSKFQAQNTTSFKLSVSPAAAYVSRVETLLACQIAQLLLRVSGSLGQSDPKLDCRKRTLLFLHLGKRLSVYSGDEWIAKNVTGALLSSTVLSHVASKEDCDMISRAGRTALLNMFSNLFGGEDKIRESFATHTQQGRYTISLNVGKSSENGSVFSDAGTAWPSLVLRMEAPTETESLEHGDTELLYLVLHLARGLQEFSSPAHLLLLVCRMVSHPRPDWLSVAKVTRLVNGLVRRCVERMEDDHDCARLLSWVGLEATEQTGRESFPEQLCRAASGEAKLVTMCTSLVEGFIAHSFASAPSVLCLLLFLRGDMAGLPCYEQILLEIGESHLLHTLQVESEDLQVTRRWLQPRKELITEKMTNIYASALAQGILTAERDPLMYPVAIQHLACVRDTWQGKLLLESLDSETRQEIAQSEL